MTAKDPRLSSAIAAATCTLLGTTTPATASADETGRWELDSALLYYGESDNRVQDVSASLLARRDFDDDRYLNLDLTFDTLSGASPSGATATDTAQTFTSPSGNNVYTTAPGDIPYDDTFLDTRVAVNVGWTQPFARLYSFTAGLGFSTEYDYTHTGINLGVTRDFNQRNTTLSAAVAYSQDDISPTGGAPIGLAQMLDVGDSSSKLGTDSKDVLDLLLGVTQVLGRSTVLRVNYSFSDSSGYLSDPYKFLSVVDAVTGDTLARVPAPGALGPTGVYRYENRPDARRKQSLFAEVKHDFSGRVLGVSYRYGTDDWNVDSHTLDAHLRWPFGESSFVEPHIRYYTQTAANFYHFSLVDGQPLPEFASADARLAELDGITLGLKYGQRSPGGNEWSARVELYRQTGSVPGEQIVGNQARRDQFPDLNAVIAQFSYRFKF